jgi:hypothetical protein
MNRLLRSVGIPATVLLMLAGVPAAADCMKDSGGEVICGKGECQRDRYGRVRCSMFQDGAAVRDRHGEILCGRGQCVTTSRGEVYCSTVWRGAAEVDRYGVPRCEDRCEPASPDYCEARSAGTF